VLMPTCSHHALWRVSFNERSARGTA
jgi:hypothetical protein